MKTVIKLLLIIILLSALAVWSPWTKFDLSITNLLGYTPPEQFSGLKVTAISGEMEVYLDNELVGLVNSSEPFLELFQIPPGTKTITLVRPSDPPGFYHEVSALVDFEPGVNVAIGYEIGPSEEFSEGHILSGRSKLIEAPVKLEINTMPENALVYVNDILIDSKIITELDLGMQHRIRVEADGYDDLEFLILPDSQEDRDRLANYDLFLDVNLMLIPVDTVVR